jgi:hypothetical protein
MRVWRRALHIGAGASVLVAIAALVTPTPADPGARGECGTLIGGGFTDTYVGCEQTRGVFRAAVLLAAVVGVLLVVGSMSQQAVWRRVAIGLVVGAFALSALLATAVLFGELTAQWIAVFPAAESATALASAVAARRGASRTGA